MANVRALQPGSKGGPTCAIIFCGQERIGVKREHRQCAVRMFAIDRDIHYVLVMETGIGGNESCAAIFADLHAFALSSQNDALRILRIDQDRVYNPVAWCCALPLDAFIGSLPQTAGGAGIQRVRMLRILFDQLRATKDERNAAVTFPVLPSVHAVINPRARGSMYVRRICRIDHDAHHIRVVNHALDHWRPILAAIHGSCEGSHRAADPNDL